MEMKYTSEDLKRMQALPLDRKIMTSQTRIIEWYLKFKGRVCVSFSGGKDSSVLLHLVRTIYPEVPAVYCDTRLDYPEVREIIKATPNVIYLKPDMDFREVINTYGYCFPSKDVANYIEGARRGLKSSINKLNGFNSNGTESILSKSITKWKWLVDTDLKISSKCCDVMKEIPFKRFLKENKMGVYLGILASESLRRRYSWYQSGCNSPTTGKSKPLAFWTEQDILEYTLRYDVPLASIYGRIIQRGGKFVTTGEKRTGCIFCPIGAHLERPVNKFQRLKETHPELYKYCMEELGLEEFLTTVKIIH